METGAVLLRAVRPWQAARATPIKPVFRMEEGFSFSREAEVRLRPLQI